MFIKFSAVSDPPRSAPGDATRDAPAVNRSRQRVRGADKQPRGPRGRDVTPHPSRPLRQPCLRNTRFVAKRLSGSADLVLTARVTSIPLSEAGVPRPAVDATVHARNAPLLWNSAVAHFTLRYVVPARSPCSSLDCAKSLQGEAPCGSAVHGKVAEISPAPLPSPSLTPSGPKPPSSLGAPTPGPLPHGRQGGQGRIDDITGKGLRTAVALGTASCLLSSPPESATAPPWILGAVSLDLQHVERRLVSV